MSIESYNVRIRNYADGRYWAVGENNRIELVHSVAEAQVFGIIIPDEWRQKSTSEVRIILINSKGVATNSCVYESEDLLKVDTSNVPKISWNFWILWRGIRTVSFQSRSNEDFISVQSANQEHVTVDAKKISQFQGFKLEPILEPLKIGGHGGNFSEIQSTGTLKVFGGDVIERIEFNGVSYGTTTIEKPSIEIKNFNGQIGLQDVGVSNSPGVYVVCYIRFTYDGKTYEAGELNQASTSFGKGIWVALTGINSASLIDSLTFSILD